MHSAYRVGQALGYALGGTVRHRCANAAYRLISGTNLKNKANMASAPTTQAAIDSAGVGANGATVTATMNGAVATRVLPADTPTLRPHTVHVAGMAGPKRARRSADMPGLLQCGQAYMVVDVCLDIDDM